MKVHDAIIKSCLFVVLSTCCLQAHAQRSKEIEPNIIDINTLPTDLRFYKLKSLTTQNNFINSEDPMSRLGFVCKWEHKNDKRSKIPLRLRIGTLDYVNKLEGK